MTNRVRLHNGRTVCIPEGMSLSNTAKLLHTQGLVAGSYINLNGEAKQLTYRCGVPTLVPAVLYAQPIL